MSIKKIAPLCLLSILILASTIQAQDKELQKPFLREAVKKEEPIIPKKVDKEIKRGFFKPYRSSFIVSSLIYWGGTAADIASSQGKGFYEGNPRFRNSSGGLNTGRAIAVAGGIYGATVLLERKYPHAMFVLRSIVGVGRAAVAFTNRH